MDFDSCFGECRRARNSTNLQCQRFKQSIEIQGQGDQCNGDLKGSANCWINSDKRKKFKSKFWDDSDQEVTTEEEKEFADTYTYLAKRDRKYKEENKAHENFEYLSCTWNSPYSTWLSQMEAAAHSESLSRDQHKNCGEVTDNPYEFRQKVDFVYRVFKDFEQKLSGQGRDHPAKTAASGGITGNILELFDLNNRMCTVEEGIVKLASILEDMIKDPKRGKVPVFPAGNLLFSDPSNFDQMNMMQKMNYLKTKNDLLKSLIKAFFFNAGSVDEICSRMSSLSKDYEFNQTIKVDFAENHPSKDVNLGEMVEELKALRKQMSDVQPKMYQNYEQPPTRSEEREDLALKFLGENKLEVISEQAELVFSEDTENELDNFEESNLARNFKESTTEIKEKMPENNRSTHDISTRLSAQETELLNSSLKKVQFELFSSLDSSGKNFFKTNIKDMRTPDREESKRQTNADESAGHLFEKSDDCDSSSVSPDNSTGKYSIHEDSNELMKAVRNTLERTSGNLCKQNEREETNNPSEQPECRSKVTRRYAQRNTLTMLPCYAKGRRSDTFRTEDAAAAAREDTAVGAKEERQRPATEPRTPRIPRKSLSPLGLKPPILEQGESALLEMNSFVQETISVVGWPGNDPQDEGSDACSAYN